MSHGAPRIELQRTDPIATPMRSHLRRRGLRTVLWVFLPVFVGAASALFLSNRQTPVYEARAELGLEPSIKNLLIQGAVLPEKSVPDEIRVAQSAPVRTAVNQRLGYDPAVVVEPVGVGQATFEIVTHMSEPTMASNAANAFAEAYIALRRDQVVGDLEAAERELQQKVDDLQDEINALIERIEGYPLSQRPTAEQNFGTQRSLLVNEQGAFRNQLDQLRVARALRTSGVTLLRPASVPRSPVEPNITRNVVVGLTLGLVGGLLCAFLVEYRSGG